MTVSTKPTVKTASFSTRMTLLTCTAITLLVPGAQVTDVSNPALFVLLETKTRKCVCVRVWACVCVRAQWQIPAVCTYSEGADAANPACNQIPGLL